jgi:uncharacterized membrane protein
MDAITMNPTGPDEERMDALSDAIARVVARQREIETRLEGIERALRIPPRTQASPERPAVAQAPPPRPVVPEPAPAPPAPPSEPQRMFGATPPPPPATAPQPSSATPLESRMGMVWVNRTGVITLVLGVAFFFRYAADNGWIGERGRVILGIVAGLLTLASAERFRRHGQRIFSQGICGAGIAILYVSFYAAYGYYNLVPHGLAFALMALNTAAAGMLAVRFGSPAIAALGLIGGYLTPVVLSTGEDRPWIFLSYLLLLSVGGMALARVRNWRGLEALAFVATTFLYCSWLSEFHISNKPAATVFALAYYALFVSGRLRLLAPVCQLAAILELLEISMPHAVPFLPLAALVCAAALAVAALRDSPWMPFLSLAAFWAPYGFAHLELKQHNSPEAIFGFLTVIFFIFAAWTPWRLLRGRRAEEQDLALVAVNAACYFTAAYDLLLPGYQPYLGLFAAALALLHIGVARAVRASSRDAAFYAGVALCFTTLAIPIQFAGYRITMAWALEAAALAWIATRAGDRRLVWASLGVFGLALVRLLAVDSWMYANPDAYAALWNGRFLTFLTAAAALWLAAHWVRTGAPAAGAYVGGHFVLLWGLGLEVLAWAERHGSAPDLATLQSTSISIMLAAYAVVLVGIGFAKRSALNRILGLGLIAAVVAKLYLYDVWLLSRGMYRVAAFAGLGMFLLIMSYLYSRYRSSIESWWRDEHRG